MDQILSNLSLLVEFPIVNLKILLDGVMIGALFVLVAYGLALVWGVMNVKNLAQGDFVISGGYVSWWLVQQGFPALLGVPVAFIVMWGIGWVAYKLGDKVITAQIQSRQHQFEALREMGSHFAERFLTAQDAQVTAISRLATAAETGLNEQRDMAVALRALALKIEELKNHIQAK